MKVLRLFLLLLIVSGVLKAQPQRIYFKDKGDQLLSQFNPTDLLSPLAVDKRAARGVAIDQRDLPVYNAYRDVLREYGLQELMSSRWFNYVKVADIPNIEVIRSLPFVSHIEPVETMQLVLAGQQVTDSLIYGFAGNQI